MPHSTAAKGDHAKHRPRNHPTDVLRGTSCKWEEQVVVII